MKRTTALFLTLITVFTCASCSSCQNRYSENSFFSENDLSENLLCGLTAPEGTILYRSTIGTFGPTVYVNGGSPDDYAASVLSFLSDKNYRLYAVESLKTAKGPFPFEDSYYVTEASDLSDFYHDELHSWYFVYTANENLGQDEDGNSTLTDEHCIRIDTHDGILEYDDGRSFAYDFSVYLFAMPSFALAK